MVNSKKCNFDFFFKKKFQPLCLICQEKQQEFDDGGDAGGIKLASLLEYDRTMVSHFKFH